MSGHTSAPRIGRLYTSASRTRKEPRFRLRNTDEHLKRPFTPCADLHQRADTEGDTALWQDLFHVGHYGFNRLCSVSRTGWPVKFREFHGDLVTHKVLFKMSVHLETVLFFDLIPTLL